MPQPDMRLAQWIADRLRYRAIPNLIGRTCIIHSLPALDSTIRTCVGDVVPNVGRLVDPEPTWLRETLSKHGILDLTFDLSNNWLKTDYESGIELLDALEFLMDSEEAQQFNYVASLVGDNFEDPTLLGELEADLQQARTVLRLMLRVDPHDTEQFAITDAAVTNAASVWLHKYPYY